MKKLKIIFMGTPVFSTPILNGLIHNYDVIAVVTQPDKMVGRNQELKYTPVKELALNNHIKVLQPVDIKQDYKNITDLKPDLIVTCAYGQMIPKQVLESPKYKCINVHASLLPLLRGGAPIHKAIINGEFKTGITIMYMVSKMDAGDIISQKEIPILDSDTAGTLHNKLSLLGKDLLLETIPNIVNHRINPISQDELKATYAFNITREEEKINWDKDKRKIFNQVRGLNPWPVAYTMLDSKIIKIWEVDISYVTYPTKINGEIVALYSDGIGVKVNDGEIIIKRIQPEGKSSMEVKDYLNGLNDHKILLGRTFY